MVISSLAALAALVLLVLAFVRVRRRRGPHAGRRPGPGAAGAVYDLLNEDRRRALEIIIDQRAEATDPEHKDGKPEAG